MKKILHILGYFFNRLHVNYKNISKFHINFFNVTKSILISIIVSISLTIAIYLLLPKSSWINLYSTPNDFEIYNFTGEYVLTTNTLHLNNGILRNSTAVYVSLNKKVYELNQGELEINFINDSKIDSINNNKKFPELFSCYTIFDKEVKVNAYMQSDYGVYNGILQIQKQYSIFRKDKNIESTLSDDEIYSILVASDNTMKSSILVYNDTTMTICPNMQIYIRGEKIDIPEGASIKLSSGITDATGAIFDFSTNMVLYNSLDINNYCYLEGSCTNFSGTPSGSNSVLKQTYLNTQKEFDVGLLNVTASGKEHFQIEYELSNQKNNIQISGQSHKVTLANTSLSFNFLTFLSDNLGAIISAIFAAFIAAYIPMVITYKEDNQNNQ